MPKEKVPSLWLHLILDQETSQKIHRQTLKSVARGEKCHNGRRMTRYGLVRALLRGIMRSPNEEIMEIIRRGQENDS